MKSEISLHVIADLCSRVKNATHLHLCAASTALAENAIKRRRDLPRIIGAVVIVREVAAKSI
jgi:hypothetical protein